MNQNDMFRSLKAEQDVQRAERLDAARAAAVDRGKELFDLQVMDALWRDNPDMRAAAQGLTISQEERLARWSEVYYVDFADLISMRQFVDKMKELQVHGTFD